MDVVKFGHNSPNGFKYQEAKTGMAVNKTIIIYIALLYFLDTRIFVALLYLFHLQ